MRVLLVTLVNPFSVLCQFKVLPIFDGPFRPVKSSTTGLSFLKPCLFHNLIEHFSFGLLLLRFNGISLNPSSVCRSLRFLLFLYYYLYSSFLSSTLVLIRVYCCSLLTTCTVLLSLSSIILFCRHS